jgi:hypothetical protein
LDVFSVTFVTVAGFAAQKFVPFVPNVPSSAIGIMERGWESSMAGAKT